MVNFPTSLDSFTNPVGGVDRQNSATVPHATQHANLNDAVEALEAKVGINSSADANSLDYKVSTSVRDSELNAGISKTSNKVNVTSAATGVISGCKLTVNADTTKFDISSGVYQIVDRSTDPNNPTVTTVNFAGVTGVTDSYRTTDTATTIKLSSAGAVVQQNTPPSTSDYRTHAVVGKTIHTNKTVITAAAPFQHLAAGVDLMAMDLSMFLGVLATGATFSANGANLNINRSAGQEYRCGANYDSSYSVPNVSTISAQSPQTFLYRYRNGSGGFKTDTATTSVSPSVYDDGTGTLADPGVGKYTNQRIYVFSNGNTFIVPGQTLYNTMSAALAGLASESPVLDPQLQDANLRCVLTVKRGTTALNNTSDATFTNGGLFGVGNSASGGGSSTIPGDGNYSIQYNDNGVFNGISPSADTTYVLTSNGTGAAPSFKAAGGGGFLELSIADYQGPAVIGLLGRYTATRTGTLGSIRLVCGNNSTGLPVGSNCIAELRKNVAATNVCSSTLQITTTESPTNGQYIGTPVSSFSTASFVAGDYFDVVLTSVGSTTPAANVRALLYTT